jgi:hypothetical protein
MREDAWKEGPKTSPDANSGTPEQTPPEALERVRVVVRENKIKRLNSAKSEAICVSITNFSNKRHTAIKSTD